MAKVKFKTKRGRTVAFDTHPGRPRKLNAMAKYVKKSIGGYLKKGHSPPVAMKKVAADYRRDR